MKGEGVSPVRVTDQSRRPDAVLKGLDGRPRQHLSLGTATHRPDKWIVDIQHRPTIGRQGFNQLTLGLSDRRLPAELRHMCLAYVKHDPNPRRRDVAEVGNMSNAARAHFSHKESSLRIDAANSQWHAELVVEIARRGHRWTRLLEHLRQQILGRGLTDRARNADDL